MPATLEQIFGYERAIEGAWQSVLQGKFDLSGLGVQVNIQTSDADKVTPYVDVQLAHVVAQKQEALMTDGTRFYSDWTAYLISRVVTKRGENSNFHSAIIAQVRTQAALFRSVLTRDILPYHSIREMKDDDGTATRGVIPSLLVDYTEVTYLLQFNIWPDAWP